MKQESLNVKLFKMLVEETMIERTESGVSLSKMLIFCVSHKIQLLFTKCLTTQFPTISQNKKEKMLHLIHNVNNFTGCLHSMFSDLLFYLIF